MARRTPLLVLTYSLVAAALLVPASALSSGTSGASGTSETTGTNQASRTSQVASFDASLLVELNQVRTAHGLVPLVLSDQLNKVAEEHSRDMVAKGYFAHESSDGSAFSKRIRRFYRSEHDGYWSVGENLFWGSGDIDPASSVSAWMASPGHRANILDPTWRQIGIGTTMAEHAPGTYAGLPVVVITTDFGVRH